MRAKSEMLAPVGNDPKFLNFLVILTAGVSATLGLVVLGGWYTDSEFLVQVHPALVPMQYNTALGFLLCGVGLICLYFGRIPFTAICSAIIASIGLLTLAEYMFGVDLIIDQLLMEHYITVKTSHPGRMAATTALSFTLCGAALLAASSSGKRWLQIAELLGSVIVALGLVALGGYLGGVDTAYGWGHLTQMALHTSIGFVVVGTASPHSHTAKSELRI